MRVVMMRIGHVWLRKIGWLRKRIYGAVCVLVDGDITFGVVCEARWTADLGLMIMGFVDLMVMGRVGLMVVGRVGLMVVGRVSLMVVGRVGLMVIAHVSLMVIGRVGLMAIGLVVFIRKFSCNPSKLDCVTRHSQIFALLKATESARISARGVNGTALLAKALVDHVRSDASSEETFTTFTSNHPIVSSTSIVTTYFTEFFQHHFVRVDVFTGEDEK